MRITTRARGKNKRRHRHNHITPVPICTRPGVEEGTDEQIELPAAAEAAGLRPNFANNRRRRPLPILFARTRGFSHTQLDRLLRILFKRHAILHSRPIVCTHTTHTLQWYIFHTPTTPQKRLNIIILYCIIIANDNNKNINNRPIYVYMYWPRDYTIYNTKPTHNNDNL